MSKEFIAQIQADLKSLEGAARLPNLVRLGQALMGEYTNIGPGTPTAKPSLDASIAALEALEYLQPDDSIRAQVCVFLGYQLAARYGAHGGVTRDCDEGIRVLQEGLSSSSLPRIQRAMGQIALGQVYLARVSAYLQTSGFGMTVRSGGAAPSQATADLDSAVVCLREVIEGEPVSDEFTTVARTLMDMAEALRAMLEAMSKGVAGMDLGRLTSALSVMQKMQDKMKQGGPPGYRLPSSGFFSTGLDELAALDARDRPVAVVQGERVTSDSAPTVQRAAPPKPPEADELRRSLHALLPGGTGGREVWLAAAELLLPDTPMPDAANVDEMVALASTLVEQASGQDREQSAIDAYLLAVAFLLRHRLDEASDGADRHAGAEELLSAARAIPPSHPAAIVILRSLGAFLSEAEPMDGMLSALGDGFADRLDRVIATRGLDPGDRVTLHALRCVCRTAEALADLRRAAGTVPADYPWLASIKAASR